MEELQDRQNGADDPPCTFTPVYVGEFFEPSSSNGDFYTTYYNNQSVTISWFGGTVPTNARTPQTFSLFLEASEHPYAPTLTLLDIATFVYGVPQNSPGGDGYGWVSTGDVYGNTIMEYNWTIPSPNSMSVTFGDTT